MAKREIYTQRLRAGKRIYYFDICESSGERLYVKVSERKRTGANSQEHHRLIVYPEDLEDFVDELNELVEEFRDRYNDGEELERREPYEPGNHQGGYQGGYGGGGHRDDNDQRGRHGIPNTGRGGGGARSGADSEFAGREPARQYDEESHD